MDYNTFFSLFDEKHKNIDETCFYFKNDPDEIVHYIGYLPEFASPYWIGYCDVDGGCDFKTAKELFEAPVFDGRSLKDRWDDVVFVSIAGIDFEEWKKFCFS